MSARLYILSCRSPPLAGSFYTVAACSWSRFFFWLFRKPRCDRDDHPHMTCGGLRGTTPPDNSVQNENGTEIGGAHYGLNTAKNISWNKAPKREDYMQPIIKANAWYTLVTAKNEAINASWCKQQLARILKKSTDAIILFDVTGSFPFVTRCMTEAIISQHCSMRFIPT